MDRETSDFNEEYSYLERCFESKAEKEGSVYLPTIRPKEQADFVFIAMEPSLGRFARNAGEANEKIEQGFKDFALSVRDFILHYCVREYLCPTGKTYYVTNLSKGAMLVKQANDQRNKRYRQWLPLLIKEMNLVSKGSTRLVAIGKCVKDFLDKNNVKSIFHVPHYSQLAAKCHGEYIVGRELEFEKFKTQISIRDILIVANIVVQEANMNKLLAKEILDGLKQKSELTEAEKKLIFVYKSEFDRLIKVM